MKDNNVVLCFSKGSKLIQGVRMNILGCGNVLCYEIDSHRRRDAMGRMLIRIPNGNDFVIVLCDDLPKDVEIDVRTKNNFSIDDPWPTCVLSVQSALWKGHQPTLAIEAERYMGHFTIPRLPDLCCLIKEYRSRHFRVNRGLTIPEWLSIKRCCQNSSSKMSWDSIKVKFGIVE